MRGKNMDDENAQSILVELNSRFTELRSLILTVGSILAILMAGLNNVGFIDWAVDKVVDNVEDDPDWNPYLDDCEEIWILEVDHFIVESDAIFNVYVEDLGRCNRVHTILWMINMDTEVHDGISPEFRNELFFTDRFYDLQEGTHHVLIEVLNGSMLLDEHITIDFEVDETETENAVYGCTDSDAINYDDEATHDNGSCEFEDEEVDDCSTAEMEFYEVDAYWSNNTTFTIIWDADVTIECSLNATVRAEVFSNGTLIANSSLAFRTHYQAWDYMYINFTAPDGEDAFDELEVRIQLRQWETDPSLIWEELTLWR